jgi:rhodanese-related sulfurtransferase
VTDGDNQQAGAEGQARCQSGHQAGHDGRRLDIPYQAHPRLAELPQPGRALQTLRRDDEIIVYSTSDGRQDTRAAFDAFTAHGYRNVRCYEGGLADWEGAGYRVEGTSVSSAAPRRWPHGHSPEGLELEGGCPHCDNGWSGYGWPPAETADGACLDDQPAMAGGQAERQVV